MFKIDQIIRPNIKSLTPYSSARDEFKGAAEIFLDANENSLGSSLSEYNNLNRYPDPLQVVVKEAIGKLKKVAPESIFLGNGSDEAIDILFRAFCTPGKDNVVILPPTYGIYEVAAKINDVAIKAIPLTTQYQLNVEAIAAAIDNNTKLIFVCTPNNPTGGTIRRSDIENLLNSFNGIVIADEAYIDFADTPGLLADLSKFPNLVILQTFSKAWGLAGLRVGMAFASAEIIGIFNKIKAPYNLGYLSQILLLRALENKHKVYQMVDELKQERAMLLEKLPAFSFVTGILPSEANFLLVKTLSPDKLYNFLISNNVVVRNRCRLPLCEGGLRITIGSFAENKKLLTLLQAFQSI